ncbi:MAG TPA: FAD-dependent oxidoreductase [Streptosporangiaceae bacterium]|nr:FAD-dependent oxidoreductase [Streptosporangiaceae bacterium]
MNADVLIIGAGPAGLAAAIELRRLGAGRVLVVDREQQPGGIPRHSAHTGYGMRDLHRVLTGPAYARRYATAAAREGAEIRLTTTATGWAGDRIATLTSAEGIEAVSARAVLLATGCRERPRPARLVPGDRPAGVMTTGELQQRVYARGERLPGRALVVGAEHVSFSAMVTLAHAGADVVALVTDLPRQQSYAAFALGALARWRVPVWTSTALRRVDGRDRLTAVDVADMRSGAVRRVECETLVFTGDWIPDHELARTAGIAIDPGTRGPAVDTSLETSARSVFAAGNLVHAAEIADVAALDGVHAARHIAAALRNGNLAPAPDAPQASEQPAHRVPIAVEPPLAWISPSSIRLPALADAVPIAPPRGHFLLRSQVFQQRAVLEARQGGRVLTRQRARLIPGRPIHLDAAWLSKIHVSDGPVLVAVAHG